jgi:hypothetical protein
MKDFDLDSHLKSMRVPERDEEYWADFPQTVLAEARVVPARQRPVFCFFLPELVTVCLVAAFCIWHGGLTRSLSRDERQLRATLVRLPNNMSRLMQDEHGLHRLIEDPQ